MYIYDKNILVKQNFYFSDYEPILLYNTESIELHRTIQELSMVNGTEMQKL